MKKTERKFTVDYYLKGTEHPAEIQQMMKDLFKGQLKTLEEWAETDKSINTRRC